MTDPVPAQPVADSTKLVALSRVLAAAPGISFSAAASLVDHVSRLLSGGGRGARPGAMLLLRSAMDGVAADEVIRLLSSGRGR